MSDDKFKHTSSDLALVQDWLDAKGYSGEAKTVMDAMDLIATLRADLAAAQLVAKDNLDWFNSLKSDYDKLTADLAAARALLREARELLFGAEWRLPADTKMLARIDAALSKDEGRT